MSTEALYSLYRTLSEDYIKNDCSITYKKKYRSKDYTANLDKFMNEKTFEFNIIECKCWEPTITGYKNDSLPMFIQACKQLNIESSECSRMFDLNKVKKIDKDNADRLTSSCRKHCQKLNRGLQVRQFQKSEEDKARASQRKSKIEQALIEEQNNDMKKQIKY